METCKLCGTKYKLGVTGIERGCDRCCGVVRDIAGNAWLPEEKQQVRQPIGHGDIEIVARRAAIGGVYRSRGMSRKGQQ